LAARRVDGRVLVTEQPGHGSVLAREALAEGAALVIAWGGDGTINEVASELVFRDVSFGVIPSGSGNGLARELKIPFPATSSRRSPRRSPRRSV
jgi:diacylglycerol kinase family enzyme